MCIGVSVRSVAVVVSSLAVAALVGCQGGSPNPTTAIVKGTVTLDGKPLEGAIVSFSPQSNTGHAASGTTDAQGNYQLTSFVRDDGAVPGSYQVAITKTAGATSDASAGATDMDAAYKAAAAAGQDISGNSPAASQAAPTNVVPIKYTNPGTSELKAEVAADKENAANFDLKSN